MAGGQRGRLGRRLQSHPLQWSHTFDVNWIYVAAAATKEGLAHKASKDHRRQTDFFYNPPSICCWNQGIVLLTPQIGDHLRRGPVSSYSCLGDKPGRWGEKRHKSNLQEGAVAAIDGKEGRINKPDVTTWRILWLHFWLHLLYQIIKELHILLGFFCIRMVEKFITSPHNNNTLMFFYCTFNIEILHVLTGIQNQRSFLLFDKRMLYTWLVWCAVL